MTGVLLLAPVSARPPLAEGDGTAGPEAVVDDEAVVGVGVGLPLDVPPLVGWHFSAPVKVLLKLFGPVTVML
jgi:hypothetical protein